MGCYSSTSYDKSNFSLMNSQYTKARHDFEIPTWPEEQIHCLFIISTWSKPFLGFAWKLTLSDYLKLTKPVSSFKLIFILQKVELKDTDIFSVQAVEGELEEFRGAFYHGHTSQCHSAEPLLLCSGSVTICQQQIFWMILKKPTILLGLHLG